jgi:hypothetical protein
VAVDSHFHRIRDSQRFSVSTLLRT